MKVLLTGVTGYVGKRLLPFLIENGHEVICCVREKRRLSIHKNLIPKIKIIEVDFLKDPDLKFFPRDIDSAYYLIHSMASSSEKFDKMESKSAVNFRQYMESTSVKQVIYLSGISNQDTLSKHLASRKQVEEVLKSEKYSLTVLRAGIIVGSGSASFEIIRDIMEKMPVLIAPRWMSTKAQPIAIRDVIQYLGKVLGNNNCLNKTYDIGGPEILTYKEMMLKYAKIRKLKRRIYTSSLITPRISSFLLFFITSVSYPLVKSLIASMKHEVICSPNNLNEILQIKPITYDQALKNAFNKIMQNMVLSSWKDSMISSSLGLSVSDFIEVPRFGCYRNEKSVKVSDPEKVFYKIWTIGGDKGYYYANWLWKISGLYNQLLGGVGLKRGRRSQNDIHPGDALDFWRVLFANRDKKRMLLFSEMKIPGEAWLEFSIDDNNILHQTTTFRPHGIWKRFYWIATTPLHTYIFNGMIKHLAITE